MIARTPSFTLSDPDWALLFDTVRVTKRQDAVTSSEKLNADTLFALCPLNDIRNPEVPAGCIAGLYKKFCLDVSSHDKLAQCQSMYDQVLSASIIRSVGEVCPAWKNGPRSLKCRAAVKAFSYDLGYMVVTSDHISNFTNSILGSPRFSPCMNSNTTTCKWEEEKEPSPTTSVSVTSSTSNFGTTTVKTSTRYTRLVKIPLKSPIPSSTQSLAFRTVSISVLSKVSATSMSSGSSQTYELTKTSLSSQSPVISKASEKILLSKVIANTSSNSVTSGVSSLAKNDTGESSNSFDNFFNDGQGWIVIVCVFAVATACFAIFGVWIWARNRSRAQLHSRQSNSLPNLVNSAALGVSSESLKDDQRNET